MAKTRYVVADAQGKVVAEADLGTDGSWTIRRFGMGPHELPMNCSAMAEPVDPVLAALKPEGGRIYTVERRR